MPGAASATIAMSGSAHMILQHLPVPTTRKKPGTVLSYVSTDLSYLFLLTDTASHSSIIEGKNKTH